jgi:hypothetical protein
MRQWVLQDRCRLVAIAGMGCIGKRMLVTRLARQLTESEQFQVAVWRSLRQAPPLLELLQELMQVIALQQLASAQLNVLIRQLLKQLRQHHRLLILDNVEAVLRGGELAGTY